MSSGAPPSKAPRLQRSRERPRRGSVPVRMPGAPMPRGQRSTYSRHKTQWRMALDGADHRTRHCSISEGGRWKACLHADVAGVGERERTRKLKTFRLEKGSTRLRVARRTAMSSFSDRAIGPPRSIRRTTVGIVPVNSGTSFRRMITRSATVLLRAASLLTSTRMSPLGTSPTTARLRRGALANHNLPMPCQAPVVIGVPRFRARSSAFPDSTTDARPDGTGRAQLQASAR
jgi:hypothetical protein